MKPIIFNTEMVRAILDGRKTAMRRVIKPQPIMYGFAETHFGWHGIKQPYHPGDIMYVQETWQYLYIPDRVYIYEADADGRNKLASAWKGDWKPSTHMPKEAARRMRKMRTLGNDCIYRHFKGGEYKIITIAEHTETGEMLVIYRDIHKPNIPVYARPYDMFASKVDKEKYPDVAQEYRFEEI